jgi:hypothetical protein
MPGELDMADEQALADAPAGDVVAERELPPFSKRVKSAIEDAKLTLTEVAAICQVTPQALSNIISPPKGRNVTGCRFANKLAKALGVSVDWLLYGEGLRNPNGLIPAVPVAHATLSLQGLSPLQAGALHTLANLMRNNRLSDVDLLTLLQGAHRPASAN